MIAPARYRSGFCNDFLSPVSRALVASRARYPALKCWATFKPSATRTTTPSLTIWLLPRILLITNSHLNFMNDARSVRLEPQKLDELQHLLPPYFLCHRRCRGAGAFCCRRRWCVAGGRVCDCHDRSLEAG